MSLDLLPPDSTLSQTEFVWVRSGGQAFQWFEGRNRALFGDSPGLFLCCRSGASLDVYKPLEESGLYLTFAATDPTPEGTLHFAERFGPLGESVSALVAMSNREHLPIQYPGDGSEGVLHTTDKALKARMEVFVQWRDEVVWMRHLTALWEAASVNDRRQLSQHVRWEGGQVVHRFPAIDSYGSGADRRKGGELLWGDAELRTPGGETLFPPGDLAGPARLFVMRAINDQLKSGVSARLFWSVGRRRPEMTSVPVGLLEAMYFQFAQAVDRGWKFGQCPICHKAFRLGPGEKRTNRVTCSVTCRTYLYRRRKKQAQEMHRQGKTVKQIAKELIADADAVKNWIAKED